MLLFTIIISSLLFSAFFSGMEIAFISANRFKIEIDNKNGGYKESLLAYFTKKPAWFIGSMLLGNNIAIVIYSLYMAILLEPYLLKISVNTPIILILQTLISTFFVLIFAEFLPKVIFRINSNKILNLFSIPLIILYSILWLPTLIIITISEFILFIFIGKRDDKNESIAFKKIDLDNYLEQLTQDINIKENIENEVMIFQNALNFSDVIARDCMVPRNEILAFELEDNIENLKNKFIETGYSKILIYKETIDNIIGYVHNIELFKKPKNIKSMLLPVNIIPETITANNILEELINKKRSVAVVVDEFGGTAGMLTMEDVIEEIFGEIIDEHDSKEITHVKINENEFEFSGRIEIDYINETYHLKLPIEENYETLGGFIINHTENIPKKGDVISIDNFRIIIKEVSNTRVEWIKLLVISN
jgi:CBS domain containing-hemolysin-like protein